MSRQSLVDENALLKQEVFKLKGQLGRLRKSRKALRAGNAKLEKELRNCRAELRKTKNSNTSVISGFQDMLQEERLKANNEV